MIVDNSVPDGAPRPHFVLELSEGDTTALVLVHLLDDLSCLLLAHVESARLDQAFELFARNLTASVHVKRVEGVIDVEIWLALEALPDRLSRGLAAEVLTPDSSELVTSVGHEAIVGAINRVPMVGTTALHHVTVVSVNCNKSVRELAHVEATVTRRIVALHEQVELVASGEHTDLRKTITQFMLADHTIPVPVKDAERICHVKVRLKGQRGLFTLDIILVRDEGA